MERGPDVCACQRKETNLSRRDPVVGGTWRDYGILGVGISFQVLASFCSGVGMRGHGSGGDGGWGGRRGGGHESSNRSQ